MSDGPYAKWVATFKPIEVSTPAALRVCMRAKAGRGYCGRSSAKSMVSVWSLCACADCRAAARADGLPVKAPEGARV